MFENVAFNVVIGLVFIYLLYSLLVTILSEIISTWMGIRARLLRIAVERMLNDGYYQKIEKKKGKFFQAWRRKVLLYEPPEFKSSFAGKFYEFPAIKYLSQIEKNNKWQFSSTKPSYFSAEYFADSLMNFLEDKGAGVTEMDKIAFCLRFNTYHIQPKTLRQFVNLFESAGGNKDLYKQNIMKWFNETMDRATGWHKQKMQTISFLLGLLLAMSFNVDSIRITKILSNDKEARNQLVEMGVALSKDSTRYRDFVNSNGDTVRSQSILDTGFARITKDINAANLIMGLGWSFEDSLKNDKVKVDTKKSSDPAQLLQIQSIKDFTQKKKEISAHLTTSFNRLIINKQKLDSLVNDTVIATNLILLSEDDTAKRNLARRQMAFDTSMIKRIKIENEIISAQMKSDSAALRSNKILTGRMYGDMAGLSGTKLNLIDSISIPDKSGLSYVYGKRPYKWHEKLLFLASHIFWYNLIGFLITALALSLGAPFWFDLLNKLISIRAVGVKPEEKKLNVVTDPHKIANEAGGAPAGQTLQPVKLIPDVVEAALKHYFTQLKNIPGVKSVFSVVKNGTKQIQVNVDNATTGQEVSRQFPQLIIGNVSVPYNIVVSGTPVSQAGEKGIIKNRSGNNGFGSIGCIVERKETKSKHILSCWHVLKGDLNYSVSDDEPFIVDKNSGQLLAERWSGGIRDQFDYGLAICNEESFYQDNSFLKTKMNINAGHQLSFRFVPQADIDKQIRVKYYNGLTDTITEGILFTDSAEVDINYIDKPRTVLDVLILTSDDETTISNEGNSGSIVFDNNNKAIAMIIGGDINYTYAIRLSHIFRIHNEMDIA